VHPEPEQPLYRLATMIRRLGSASTMLTRSSRDPVDVVNDLFEDLEKNLKK
jgi:hypothetical protein